MTLIPMTIYPKCLISGFEIKADKPTVEIPAAAMAKLVRGRRGR